MAKLALTRISGRALRSLVGLAKSPARGMVARVFRSELGIEALRGLDVAVRSPLPLSSFPIAARAEHPQRAAVFDDVPRSGALPGASDYQTKYRAGVLRPTEVVARFLSAAKTMASQTPSSTPFSALDERGALAAARASEERIAHHQPLSVFDGVIVPIKEEMRVCGFPTRLGSRSVPERHSTEDAVAVSRLRAAGALIIAETMMTEFGLSPLGVNPFYSMPRNPWDPRRLAGGSSTGSAVAVALGLAPVALGCDGGGSIRTPAAFCGVFGLKPTFGRIPITGHGAGFGNTVTQVGPIAASCSDLASFVELTSGADPHDAASELRARLKPDELRLALRTGVSGIRIGVDERLWSEAAADVTRPLGEALSALEGQGAKIVSVCLPLAKHAAALGYVTIALEGCSAMLQERRRLSELSVDLQLLLSVVAAFEPDDYLLAQRVRGALRRETAEVLREVDVLALPTTAGSPPIASEKEAASSFVDPAALESASRFCYVPNLCGLPAGTAPVGFDGAGMPVGLQIVGDAWDEASVLSVMGHLERMEVARTLRPPGTFELGA